MVTQHAKERYVERVNPHIEIRDVERELLTKDLIKKICTIKTGTITITNYMLLIKNYMIITVMNVEKIKPYKKAKIVRSLVIKK